MKRYEVERTETRRFVVWMDGSIGEAIDAAAELADRGYTGVQDIIEEAPSTVISARETR